MPLHIPLTVYPSLLSSNPNNATFSSHSSPASSPSSSSSSSSLIEERFIPPTSSQGVWIRIKGYTQHLSPIGQRYARELPNKIGIEANQYIETLLEDREGVLKVEALKDGKVLAVVNSRLSKEEEEVFYKFRRSTSTPTSPRPTASISTSTSTSREEDGVRRSSWVNRRTDEDGRIRFNRRTIIQDSPSDEEVDDDDEEDYSDLPPLVSLAPGESFYSTSPSQTTEPQPSQDSPQDHLSFLFTPPTLPSRSDRFNHVLPPPPPTHAPIRARDHLFYSHPNSSSYLPPAPATASTIDNDNEDDEEGSNDAMVEERIERARLYGEPMDEIEDTRERRRRVAEETVVLRSMNRYTGRPSSRTPGRETVGR